jgi:hypothetical protein
MSKKRTMELREILLQKKRCDQCLFSSAKIVSDARKAELVKGCLKRDIHFVCHKGSIAGEATSNLVCRGFYEEHHGVGFAIRIAHVTGTLREVHIDIPKDKP